MQRSGRFAIVTEIALFIGLVGTPTVACAADLDRSQGIDSASALRPDLPFEGLSAAGWQRILAQLNEARFAAGGLLTTEVAKPTAADAAASDWFGHWVAIPLGVSAGTRV